MKVSTATVSLGAAAQLAQIYPELIKDATILSSALSIESQNTHPVGQAIAEHIASQGIKATTVTDYSVSPGNGAAGRVNLGIHSPVVLIGSPAAVAHSSVEFHPEIKAAINAAQADALTVSVMAWDGVALAVFAVGDEIKADAALTIAKFKALGISPWLITGDSPGVAHSVALKVGIDINQVTAAASPESKLAAITNLQSKGHKVLMIGDGINDAAALAAALAAAAAGARRARGEGAGEPEAGRPRPVVRGCRLFLLPLRVQVRINLVQILQTLLGLVQLLLERYVL
jgi:Cu+-exporting ATPase